MRKATVTISFDQEKLKAVQFYAGKNDTSLEAELDAFMEPIPRIMIVASSPGSPELFNTCTPLLCPCKAWVTLDALIFSSDSFLTTLADPVKVDFFPVP